MEKIKEYIKENYKYLIVMFIGLAAIAIQMKYVVLYADDMSLAVVSRENGFIGAIKYFYTEYYLKWGGGPTPLVAIFFLWFSPKVWKIFNCGIILVTIALITRMVTYNKKQIKAQVAAILWFCIFLLNIYIARETTLWLDGSLAYVLTTFQLVVYFYYLYSRLIMKTKERKYDYILLPIIAFFSGWTGPQVGALTCLTSIILILWAKFIKKENIKKRYIIFVLVGMLGFLVEYLAPGNNIRMQNFTEYKDLSLINKTLYRASGIWSMMFDFKSYKMASVPFFFFILTGIIGIITFKSSDKEEKKWLKIVVKIMSVVSIAFVVIYTYIGITGDEAGFLSYMCKFEDLYANINNGTFNILQLVTYIITSIIMFNVMVLSLYISIKNKDAILVTAVVASIAGQIMMIFAPYTPPRATYISLVFFWMAIAYLIKLAYEKEYSIKSIIILVVMMHSFNIGILAMVVAYIINSLSKDNKNKSDIVFILVMLGCLAFTNYAEVVVKYAENEKINDENVYRLENYNGDTNEIYLIEPKYAEYGFDGMVGAEWIEDTVKDYFKLPDEVILMYEK